MNRRRRRNDGAGRRISLASARIELAITDAGHMVTAGAAQRGAQQTQCTDDRWNVAHGILAFLPADFANGCLLHEAEKPPAPVCDTLNFDLQGYAREDYRTGSNDFVGGNERKTRTA